MILESLLLLPLSARGSLGGRPWPLSNLLPPPPSLFSSIDIGFRRWGGGRKFALGPEDG